jgi:predicted glycoside hydrolase/deacetylase ChbG (UPF0249 family)
MKSLRYILLLFLPLAAQIHAQNSNIPELLGYPSDTKLLIIHGDDIGLSHSTNMAVIKAFEEKGITSGSMMVPCPWSSEFAEYAKSHPGLDIGIHFTINSEWKYYKFGGILSQCEIPSLLDKNGHFYPTVEQVAMAAKPEEMEKELRAQIDRAIAMGIQPTHLDSHMGSMYVTPLLFRVVVKVAREYGLPVSLPYNLLGPVAPFLKNELTPGMVGVDNFLMLQGNAVKGDWVIMYNDIVNAVKPGLNEIVVHLSYDNDEMRAIAVDHEDYGSAWRQKDLDLVTSDAFKKLLKENNIQLVTWKQIQDAVYPDKKKSTVQ